MSLHVTCVFMCSQLSAPCSKKPTMAMRATLVSHTEREKGRMKMLSIKDSGGWRNRNAFLLQKQNWSCTSTIILAWWSSYRMSDTDAYRHFAHYYQEWNTGLVFNVVLQPPAFRSYLTKCMHTHNVPDTGLPVGTESARRTKMPVYLNAAAARCSFLPATNNVGVPRKNKYVF